MDTNVGGMDRTARLVVGPILVVVGAALLAGLFSLGEGTVVGLVVPVLALVVGLVLTVTGYARTCPVNSMLGVNTSR